MYDAITDEEEEAYLSLTVWRKSLVYSCKGFTVIGSNGSLVYRVDNYSNRPNQIFLMDASGFPIFTICPPKVHTYIHTYISILLKYFFS